MGFLFVLKSMTLNDLERLKLTSITHTPENLSLERNGWIMLVLQTLFLAKLCNCNAKFGYCHDMLSVVRRCP